MDYSKAEITDAVIYTRVSSGRQVREGDGLHSQEQRCREYAKGAGYEVLAVFRDPGVSGGLLDRPGIQELLDFLEQRIKPTIVLVDDISRWARNTVHHFQLKEAIKRSGGVLVSLNQNFEDSPEGKFIETMMAASSELDRNRNARQVRSRMKARMQNGYWTFSKVPTGYKYEKQNAHGKVLVKNEPLASIVKEALEGFSIGKYKTQADVQRYLEKYQVFPRTPAGRVNYDKVQVMLRSVVYAGYLEKKEWGVALTPGKHEPLIPLSTFQKIQERLGESPLAVSRGDKKEDFPLRGYVMCDSCSITLTASWSKGRNGRYAYYHCKNTSCDLYGKGSPRDLVHADFEVLLNKVSPNPAMLELTKAVIHDIHKEKQKNFTSRFIEREKSIKAKGELLSKYAMEAVKAKSDTLRKVYEKEIEKLELEREGLRQEQDSGSQIDTGFDAALGTVLSFMCSPLKLWQQGGLEEKHTVLNLTFARKLRYTKAGGFGTAALSLPFSVFQACTTANTNLVEHSGIEPLTSSMPC